MRRCGNVLSRHAVTTSEVAGDIVLQSRFDGSDHLGRIFPAAPAAGAAHPLALDLLGKQLLTTAGDGAGIDSEEPGDMGVAAPTTLEGLKALPGS